MQLRTMILLMTLPITMIPQMTPLPNSNYQSNVIETIRCYSPISSQTNTVENVGFVRKVSQTTTIR